MLRYLICRAVAAPNPPAFFNWARYPRTLAGSWRYFREQIAPAEVRYHRQRKTRKARAERRPV